MIILIPKYVGEKTYFLKKLQFQTEKKILFKVLYVENLVSILLII